VAGTAYCAKPVGGDPRGAEVAGCSGEDTKGLVGSVGFEASGREESGPTAHRAGVVASTLNMVPGLARAHVAAMDGFDDLYAVRVAAVVHEEGGEGELNA
jgi:hypothetical protein